MKYSKELALLVVSIFLVCAMAPVFAVQNSDANMQFETSWTKVNKKYENFTDYGNYTVRVDNYDKDTFEGALKYMKDRGYIPRGGCTAFATKNSDGEVIMGRNYDETISQNPAYLVTTSFGKYKTSGVLYSPYTGLKYADLLSQGKIDQDLHDVIPYFQHDIMNEKGLFIEENMREPNPLLENTGTNPNASQTMPVDAIPLLVSLNCANVKEAIEYINNSYNYISLVIESIPKKNGTNIAMMIGDAEGNYGLIEVASNKVSYIPYNKIQANFYITPEFAEKETYGTGYGRYAAIQEKIEYAQDVDSALSVMVFAKWCQEILSIEPSYRDADGSIVFCDYMGIETIDWRSDHVCDYPVNSSGQIVLLQSEFDEISYSDIKEILRKEITAGRLLIEADDSDFAVLKANAAKYDLAAAWIGEDGTELTDEQRKELMDKYENDWNQYTFMVRSMNVDWVLNNDNFELMRALIVADYRDNSIVENLLKYYAGNEDPLRDSGLVWTTGVSSGANCAKKEYKVVLWEDTDVVISFKW